MTLLYRLAIPLLWFTLVISAVSSNPADPDEMDLTTDGPDAASSLPIKAAEEKWGERYVKTMRGWKTKREDFDLLDMLKESEQKQTGLFDLPSELFNMVEHERRYSNAVEKQTDEFHLPLLHALIFLTDVRGVRSYLAHDGPTAANFRVRFDSPLFMLSPWIRRASDRLDKHEVAQREDEVFATTQDLTNLLLGHPQVTAARQALEAAKEVKDWYPISQRGCEVLKNWRQTLYQFQAHSEDEFRKIEVMLDDYCADREDSLMGKARRLIRLQALDVLGPLLDSKPHFSTKNLKQLLLLADEEVVKARRNETSSEEMERIVYLLRRQLGELPGETAGVDLDEARMRHLGANGDEALHEYLSNAGAARCRVILADLEEEAARLDHLGDSPERILIKHLCEVVFLADGPDPNTDLRTQAKIAFFADREEWLDFIMNNPELDARAVLEYIERRDDYPYMLHDAGKSSLMRLMQLAVMHDATLEDREHIKFGLEKLRAGDMNSLLRKAIQQRKFVPYWRKQEEIRLAFHRLRSLSNMLSESPALDMLNNVLGIPEADRYTFLDHLSAGRYFVDTMQLDSLKILLTDPHLSNTVVDKLVAHAVGRARSCNHSAVKPHRMAVVNMLDDYELHRRRYGPPKIIIKGTNRNARSVDSRRDLDVGFYDFERQMMIRWEWPLPI